VSNHSRFGLLEVTLQRFNRNLRRRSPASKALHAVVFSVALALVMALAFIARM